MSSVIVAGSRTPIGRFNGALASVSAVELGGIAIRGALDRTSLTGSDVDYIIMGEVLQAGAGQNPARQAAAGAGIPMDVPALTVNKVCLSGLEAIALADKLIRTGEFTTVVAGGMESMSRAPHLLTGSRAGLRYGDVNLIDHLAHDGLHDAFTDVQMGELTESANDVDFVSRLEQDAFAARSHQRAAAAIAAGVFTPEIAPVLIKTRHGEILVDTDEGVRADNTVKTLAALRPSFRKDGTITAGSASQISDGAVAVIVMDKAEAARRGLDWIAEIGAHGSIAGPDSTLQDKPARAIQKACDKAGITPSDLDLVEINEAFACVGISTTRALHLHQEQVNINGGAIALGHPIGASGARLVLHLALELHRRGGGTGAAALCGGGGQGDALLVSVPKAG